MSYILNKTNGQILLQLPDGTADGPEVNPGLNVSDLNFIGKNYPNYGTIQNENFIKLLENFSNTTPPVKPIMGQLWYDTSNAELKVFNGTTFVPVTPLTTSDNQPGISRLGDMWLDTANDQFKLYNGTDWITIGPAYSKQDGKSGALVENIYDVSGRKHTVVGMYTNNNLTAIVSFDPVFQPNVTIFGFSYINPGINLTTNNDGALLHGTATNAQQLGNITAAQYARKDIDESFAGNISVGSGNFNVTSAGGAVNLVNTAIAGGLNILTSPYGSPVRVLSIDGSTGEVRVSASPTSSYGITNKQYVDNLVSTTASPLATKANPAFTGNATAPTPPTADYSTRIATTAFTKNAIADADTALWLGSGKTVSADTPSPFLGNVGDFWFQI